MSRIGNKIIPLPSGVKIQIKDGAVDVQGPKGKMTCACLAEFIRTEGRHARSPSAKPKIIARCMAWRGRLCQRGHRRHAGIQEGSRHRRRRLPRGSEGQECRPGAGLFAPDRVSDSGRHPDRGRKADAHDRFRRGQESSRARWRRIFARLRPPDPYKQKGIRITGERLKKKAGKAGAKTAA